MRKAVLLLVVAAGPPCGAADEPMPDKCVQIVAKQSGDEVTLSAALSGCTEATITLSAELQNATASRPLPVTVDAAGRQSFEIVRLQRADSNLPWKYKTRQSWQLGRRGDPKKGPAARPHRVVYALPYGKETHKVAQGWFGSFSHGRGSNNEYAIDFEMPVGTKVLAAREGEVVAVRQDSSAGGADDKFGTSANYVVVRHADGTFAEYLHLKHNGVLVSLGDKVRAHQVLGVSGNTGHSMQPHLHFAVFNNIDGNRRATVPVKFKTRAGSVVELKEGEEY
jgi:murein DD-endopeptidase MepM/ murein hydrolase activator NlpD